MAKAKSRFRLAEPQSLQAFEARYLACGIRMGCKRRVVACVVGRITGPFDFDDVYKSARGMDAKISRDTIYLTLRRLHAAGLICEYREPE